MANSKNRCTHCREYFPAGRMVVVGKLKFCCDDHKIAYAVGKGRIAAKAQREERERIKSMSVRDLNRSSLKWQHDKTQKVFNRLRVLQEKKWYADQGLEPVCISCQRPLGFDQWCCGHLKTVKARSDLRYDPLNTHLQHNRRCNQQLSGDIAGTDNTPGYLEGIKVRYGEERAEEIIEYLNRDPGPRRYTCEELEGMRKEFNRQIREIKKGL